MNKFTVGAVIIVIVLIGWATLSGGDSKVVKNSIDKNQNSYTSISSNQLSNMLESKDFTLIDVHIPEQVHIPGTDYMIPYTNIDEIISRIPNKDSKVVLYCRSGGMSKAAAEELVKRGYTNVYELKNGMNEWQALGNPILPKGSIKTPSDQNTDIETGITDTTTTDVKEFNLTASNFKFSANEIKVKKGDKVRVVLNNSQGIHDFKIDELGVNTRIIQQGEQDIVEFVADKVGVFEYYCSVGNHRELGMRGKFIVE